MELKNPFGDMAHIIYVNGEDKSKTKLGKLMHDFHCTDAKDMHYKLLADRVRYFKETQKGRNASSGRMFCADRSGAETRTRCVR